MWRNQIIRDLADKKQIHTAGEYTQFLDEVVSHESWVVRDSELTTQDSQLKTVLSKVDRFIAGLRKLKINNNLTPQNIVNILHRPTIVDIASTSAVLARHAEILPMEALAQKAFLSKRSELRKGPPDLKQITLEGERKVVIHLNQEEFAEHFQEGSANLKAIQDAVTKNYLREQNKRGAIDSISRSEARLPDDGQVRTTAGRAGSAETELSADDFENALIDFLYFNPRAMIQGKANYQGHEYSYTLGTSASFLNGVPYFRAGDYFVINARLPSAAASIRGSAQWYRGEPQDPVEIAQREFETLLSRYPKIIWSDETSEGWDSYNYRVTENQFAAETVSAMIALQAQQQDIKDKPFVDIGSRNGFLGILALQLGASEAVLIENDPVNLPPGHKYTLKSFGSPEAGDLISLNLMLNHQTSKARIIYSGFHEVVDTTPYLQTPNIAFNLPNFGIDYSIVPNSKRRNANLQTRPSMLADVMEKIPTANLIFAGGGVVNDREDFNQNSQVKSLRKKAQELGLIEEGIVNVPSQVQDYKPHNPVFIFRVPTTSIASITAARAEARLPDGGQVRRVARQVWNEIETEGNVTMDSAQQVVVVGVDETLAELERLRDEMAQKAAATDTGYVQKAYGRIQQIADFAARWRKKNPELFANQKAVVAVSVPRIEDEVQAKMLAERDAKQAAGLSGSLSQMMITGDASRRALFQRSFQAQGVKAQPVGNVEDVSSELAAVLPLIYIGKQAPAANIRRPVVHIAANRQNYANDSHEDSTETVTAAMEYLIATMASLMLKPEKLKQADLAELLRELGELGVNVQTMFQIEDGRIDLMVSQIQAFVESYRSKLLTAQAA